MMLDTTNNSKHGTNSNITDHMSTSPTNSINSNTSSNKYRTTFLPHSLLFSKDPRHNKNNTSHLDSPVDH